MMSHYESVETMLSDVNLGLLSLDGFKLRRLAKQGRKHGLLVKETIPKDLSSNNLARKCPAPALQRNLDLCIPRKGIGRPQSIFHIHVSVSDLYIPTFGPTIFLQQNRQTDQGNI
jgi:hypothetical protein